MQRFYFDHNATTPVSPEVLEAMLPVLTEVYGNASSIHHFGQLARQRLDSSRKQVADLLGAEPQEIVFTSGGTEADNLAIFGVAIGSKAGRVVTTTFEHPAVLAAAAQLDHTLVPVDGRGMIDPEAIRGYFDWTHLGVDQVSARTLRGGLERIGWRVELLETTVVWDGNADPTHATLREWFASDARFRRLLVERDLGDLISCVATKR